MTTHTLLRTARRASRARLNKSNHTARASGNDQVAAPAKLSDDGRIPRSGSYRLSCVVCRVSASQISPNPTSGSTRHAADHRRANQTHATAPSIPYEMSIALPALSMFTILHQNAPSPIVSDRRPGAPDPRLTTRASSRGSLHLACSAPRVPS
jgi:hypothetical protein